MTALWHQYQQADAGKTNDATVVAPHQALPPRSPVTFEIATCVADSMQEGLHICIDGVWTDGTCVHISMPIL